METSPSQANTRLRALVIDRDIDQLNSLAELLRLLNVRVETAFEGRSGLAKATTNFPDIVFVDLTIHDIDVLELARNIRQRGWGQELSLVGLSGSRRDVPSQELLAAGYDRLVFRPYDWPEIANILTEFAEGNLVNSGQR